MTDMQYTCTCKIQTCKIQSEFEVLTAFVCNSARGLQCEFGIGMATVSVRSVRAWPNSKGARSSVLAPTRNSFVNWILFLTHGPVSTNCMTD